jgi:hypothetical protein
MLPGNVSLYTVRLDLFTKAEFSDMRDQLITSDLVDYWELLDHDDIPLEMPPPEDNAKAARNAHGSALDRGCCIACHRKVRLGN